MRHRLAAAFFVLFLAVPASGADTSAATVHEYNVDLEEIMQKVEKAVDAGARDLIARQPDAKSAGDVALIIGIFHHIGLFHGVDVPRAREFMEVALENGVVEAGVALGELHLGFALPGAESETRDPGKALAYLNAAAGHGDREALERLEPLFEEAAAREREHPEQKADMPTSAEDAIDLALAEAAFKRGEELSAVAAMVHAESEKWAMHVIEEEKSEK